MSAKRLCIATTVLALVSASPALAGYFNKYYHGSASLRAYIAPSAVSVDDGFSYNIYNYAQQDITASDTPPVLCLNCRVRVLFMRTDGSHFCVRDSPGGSGTQAADCTTARAYTRAKGQNLVAAGLYMRAYKTRD